MDGSTPARHLSRRDIAFLLHEWLDVTSLTARPRYAEHSRDTFDAALDTYELVAVDCFAPHYRALDIDEPRLVDGQVRVHPAIGPALRAFSAAGLMAATQDAARGGMQLPFVVERAGVPTPIQVTWDAPTERHEKAIDEFHAAHPNATEAVIVTAASYERGVPELVNSESST